MGKKCNPLLEYKGQERKKERKKESNHTDMCSLFILQIRKMREMK